MLEPADSQRGARVSLKVEVTPPKVAQLTHAQTVPIEEQAYQLVALALSALLASGFNEPIGLGWRDMFNRQWNDRYNRIMRWFSVHHDIAHNSFSLCLLGVKSTISPDMR